MIPAVTVCPERTPDQTEQADEGQSGRLCETGGRINSDSVRF